VSDQPVLSERQAMVLRAMVRAYVGEAQPIASQSLSHVLPMKLSSASVRATLADLAGLGLVEKPHASAGRIPTERGLRLFVDQLLDSGTVEARTLGSYLMRSIACSVDEAEADSLSRVASQLLSDGTHQLGFVFAPSLERIVIRHVSLVRLSTEKVLAVLVANTGSAYRRVIENEGDWDQPELDRIGALLRERVVGRTLVEARAGLLAEAKALRKSADALLARVVELGRRAVASLDDDVDLVIATRLALLEQPEFSDPRRIRDLFGTLETKERLLEVVDQMLASDGVQVAFGDEVDEPGLRQCALVASRYGGVGTSLGVLGVVGPVRMDYSRVIPMVDYLSQVITDRLASEGA
jgi:heat-inducible transcriptional repressor